MAVAREHSGGRSNSPVPNGTTEATQRQPRQEPITRGGMVRSIVAVIAGMLAIFVLSIGTDEALRAARILPPPGEPVSNGLLLLATAYRTVFAIAGGYLTARLAPRRRMAHALVLGGIGVVLSTLGAVATWNGGPEFEHKWYPIALIVTAMPCTWAGGRLCERDRGPAQIDDQGAI